jgi:hypothetical protein
MTRLPDGDGASPPAGPSEESTPTLLNPALDRRRFLGVGGVSLGTLAGGLTGLSTLSGVTTGDGVAEAAEIGPESSLERRFNAWKFRTQAATKELQVPVPFHLDCNGDEDLYPNRIGSYHKSLPHDATTGEVDGAAYDAMLEALEDGDFAAFNAVPTPGSLKQLSPLAGLTFNLVGPDNRVVVAPPFPALASRELAAQAAELYWMALLRDVPFRDWDTHPLVAEACADLDALPGYEGPRDALGDVTPQVLFRMDAPGCLDGPWISQVITRGFVYDGMVFSSMAMQTPLPGEDFVTDYTEWINCMNGFPGGNPGFSGVFDPVFRWPRSLRDAGQIAGQDVLYTAHLRAILILRGLFFEANPYTGSPAQSPFANYGLADLTLRLAEACQSERHVWFFKWFVHRALRPEAYGGLVHRVLAQGASYPIHPDLLVSSTVLPKIFAYNQARNAARGLGAANPTYLLPQMFRQGAPTHPTYPAGHAITAGACVTVLKAFYDENAAWPGPRKVKADGSGFDNYVPGVDGPVLTVGGEFNKLAMNLTHGRDASGVHFRSDGFVGLQMGEEIAIRILREARKGYPEPPSGWTLTKFDGTPVAI